MEPFHAEPDDTLRWIRQNPEDVDAALAQICIVEAALLDREVVRNLPDNATQLECLLIGVFLAAYVIRTQGRDTIAMVLAAMAREN